MPRLLHGAGSLVFVGFLLGGCAAERRSVVLIEPEYSVARGDGSVEAATPPLPEDTTSIDALASYLEAHGLMEPTLMRPSGRLVEAETEPSTR